MNNNNSISENGAAASTNTNYSVARWIDGHFVFSDEVYANLEDVVKEVDESRKNGIPAWVAKTRRKVVETDQVGIIG